MARRSARLSGLNKHTVDVVTYNVLSHKLARADFFTSCNAASLKAGPRLELVQQQLEAHTARGALICLQEVSQKWGGSLHAWFAQRGYHFVLSCYGGDFNGYMGVAVAFPLPTSGGDGGGYVLEDVDITRIGDTLVRAPRDGHGSSTALRSFAALPVVSHVGAVLGGAWAMCIGAWGQLKRRLPAAVEKALEGPLDPFAYSRKRNNTCISVRLRPAVAGAAGDSRGGDGGCFWFSTYHMPCAFWAPPVMTVHAALVAQHVQKLAASGAAVPEPCILAGDFNYKPGFAQHEMMQNGTLDEKHPECPIYPAWMNWRPALREPFPSAHMLLHGEEPAFTNYSVSRNGPLFAETLDYIFVSAKSIDATATAALPTREDYAHIVSLPTEDEPSDHLLVSATLEISV